MRLSLSRFASALTLGVNLSMALVLTGVAIDIDGVDCGLHVRVTRIGAQRPDTDGSHVAGDLEGAALSVAEQAAADQGLTMAGLPAQRLARLAPPTAFQWLAEPTPAAPVACRCTVGRRDRAPPAV